MISSIKLAQTKYQDQTSKENHISDGKIITFFLPRKVVYETKCGNQMLSPF